MGRDPSRRVGGELGESRSARTTRYDRATAVNARTRTVRVRTVKPLAGFVLRLGFDDGTVRDIDLEADLWGPVFEPLHADPELFRQVRPRSEDRGRRSGHRSGAAARRFDRRGAHAAARPPPAERDLARLVTVADGDPIRVVLALERSQADRTRPEGPPLSSTSYGTTSTVMRGWASPRPSARGHQQRVPTCGRKSRGFVLEELVHSSADEEADRSSFAIERFEDALP